MFCSRCGASIEGTPSYCPNCGAPVVIAAAAAIPEAAGSGTYPGASPMGAASVSYGGFWRRVGASILDGVLLNIASFPLVMMLMIPMGSRFENLSGDDMNPEELAAVFGVYATLGVIGTVMAWLYYAFLHSSPRQATVGMMAVGIQVTDLEGRRLSFARATGRYFASLLSGMTLGIGYLVMLFTERRQTLHDLIAGTLVMRKGS